jgi:hypothetical protein
LTNNKQRGKLCTLVVRREKRKKKHKQSITNNNSTIIRLHAPHHVKKETVTHLGRRRIDRIDHWVALHTPPTPWCVFNNFLIKNYKTWKYQNAPMTLLITQITNVKIPKYPPKASFFFVFYEDKSIISLYMEIEKTWNTFFILGVKKYFYCYEYCEKPRKAPLVNHSKFYWL